jgi:hypothetical protein
VASALAIVIAAAGAAAAQSLKNHWLPVAAALIAVVFAVTHFEAFEHQLLAGWAPAVVQRISTVVALGFGASVVGSELVIGLGATPTVEPATVKT